MQQDRGFRIILIVSFVFNMVGASLFGFPGSLMARMVNMPWPPVIYRTVVTAFILIFGLAYLWLALQPVISRVLVGFSAVMKLAIFGAIAVTWFHGDTPMTGLMIGTGDLVFAGLYVWWLRTTPATYR
jgi:hypothetical protein